MKRFRKKMENCDEIIDWGNELLFCIITIKCLITLLQGVLGKPRLIVRWYHRRIKSLMINEPGLQQSCVLKLVICRLIIFCLLLSSKLIPLLITWTLASSNFMNWYEPKSMSVLFLFYIYIVIISLVFLIIWSQLPKNQIFSFPWRFQ